MSRQLFIYYRIPKADIALGLTCANQLIALLEEQGLGKGELFLREEADKPYFTLMEVIHPAVGHLEQISEFTAQVELWALQSFSQLSQMPARHTEIFSKIPSNGIQPCA